MLDRSLTTSISTGWFQGRIIMLLGPRQVGKTTLIETLLKDISPDEIIRFSGDREEDISLLSSKSFAQIGPIIGSYRYIIIDEAQKIPSIGTMLKILVDTYRSEKQIFITGSSSFRLTQLTEEPLTGRKRVYHLYPLSLEELTKRDGLHDVQTHLSWFLRYGLYPAVINSTDEREKREVIKELSSSYLYQDILEFQDVKNATVIHNLLKILALRIGQEISLHDIGKHIGLDSRTVERYIDLLEKSYIIFRLPPYYTNKEKEITKMHKVYFYDVGIRNALLESFGPLDARSDIGHLWENFIIAERMKYIAYHSGSELRYFWRTRSGQEIDYIEEEDGQIYATEIKWSKSRKQAPDMFTTLYPKHVWRSVTRENWYQFVINGLE